MARGLSNLSATAHSATLHGASATERWPPLPAGARSAPSAPGPARSYAGPGAPPAARRARKVRRQTPAPARLEYKNRKSINWMPIERRPVELTNSFLKIHLHENPSLFVQGVQWGAQGVLQGVSINGAFENV